MVDLSFEMWHSLCYNAKKLFCHLMNEEISVILSEQRECSLANQAITIIRASDNNIYVSISQICRIFHLDPGAQARRIKRRDELRAGLRVLIIQTPGGEQRTNCLCVDQFNSWLVGIDRELQEPTRSLLVHYREQLRNLAYQMFDLETPAKTQDEAQAKNLSDMPLATVDEASQATNGKSAYEQALAASDGSSRTLLTKWNTDTRMVVTTYGADPAFRESCLARLEDWHQPKPELPNDPFYYTSSGTLKVYLTQPGRPLDLPQAIEQIKRLGIRTVQIARLALAFWNSERYAGRLTETGSVAISVDDVLHWLNLDGSVKKYRLQLYRDFFYLQNCHLIGQYTYRDAQGRPHQISIDGPYMRVSTVRETTLWGEEIIGFVVAPGDWITTHARTASGYFGLLDHRMFGLNPQNDQYALYTGWYLIEWLSQAFQGANPSLTLTIEQLLRGSMIEFDQTTFPLRFTERVEAGLQTLFDLDLLAEPPGIARRGPAHKHWREEWLAQEWFFQPRLDKVQGPLLLPPDSSRSRRKK